MNKLNEYLTISEAAKFIGVSKNTLRTWERANKIKTLRNPMNQYRLYKKEDLEVLLKNISNYMLANG